ncbi:F420-dependent glucose-6-phosphate dehydrogenase [Mycobacteroides abscessus]|nr:F420-dependent glucose-6-phosphate dehydrogenase [Mycobacteroides abscessus]
MGRRQAMLREAIQIIRDLLCGEHVDGKGDYFEVDSARLWDLPDVPVPIGVAVSSGDTAARFAPTADHMIAVAPESDIVDAWRQARRSAAAPEESRVIGQLPICWDTDREAAIKRAHDEFRWFAGGWPVNADLPTPAGFAAATKFVRPEDVAGNIPCGSDFGTIIENARAYADAGFTDIALVQVGGDSQDSFLTEAAEPLLAELRASI